MEFITSELQKTTEFPPIADCSGETELLKFPKPNLEYGELVDSWEKTFTLIRVNESKNIYLFIFIIF